MIEAIFRGLIWGWIYNRCRKSAQREIHRRNYDLE